MEIRFFLDREPFLIRETFLDRESFLIRETFLDREPFLIRETWAPVSTSHPAMEPSLRLLDLGVLTPAPLPRPSHGAATASMAAQLLHAAAMPRHRGLCATTQVRRGRRARRTYGVTLPPPRPPCSSRTNRASRPRLGSTRL
jgi:hypothetical protein